MDELDWLVKGAVVTAFIIIIIIAIAVVVVRDFGRGRTTEKITVSLGPDFLWPGLLVFCDVGWEPSNEKTRQWRHPGSCLTTSVLLTMCETPDFIKGVRQIQFWTHYRVQPRKWPV